MKINMLLSGCLLGLLCFTACDSEGNEMNDYTHYVNPFIGTGGHGHTHPGAMVPHGMIQPGPDTRIDGWDSCSGYYYEDTTINGFAHTRLSGTGCADFGDFLLMPTVGVQRTDFLGTESQKRPFASAFSHEKEYAEPGYYSVFLDTYGVKAELTSTERAAMHRYTFPESKESGFILDMDYNIQQQINQVMEVEAVNDTVLRGRKRSAYWAYRQDLYFYAVFSKPFTYTLYTDTVQENDKQIPVCKMLLHFETAKDEQVLAKFSISSVDAEGAYKNLQAEMSGWNFDGVRADAKKKWNECLSKIAVKTNDEDQRAIFYTAMYHAFLSPNLFTDVDGRYLGMDLKVHTTDMKHPVYTIFSLWDTFRALHPLLTIVDPQLNTEFIRSLIKKHQEGGIFPKWDCVSNYTGTMVGYHAASLVTDSYVKGYRDFDVQEAYKACLRAAEYDTTGIVAPDWLIPYVMPKARYYKNTLGYIPCDRENESVAKALEYAYDDWCIS
ncbi:GH92 family glycosyl hydrolase, partial [Phocaeicola vulgatus]